MARKVVLPTHSEKAGAIPGTTATTSHGLNWNIRRPTQGPVGLAIKNHFVAMVGEYVGTTMFLLLALGGTNVANIPTTSVTGATTEGQSGSVAAAVNTSSLLYIALSFGFSLAVNAWIFFRVSGGLFNPAVSLGMVLVGALTPLRGILLTIAQILGAMTGSAIIQALTPGTLNVRTQLAAGVSIARGLFIEMFMTALLMITILLLAAEKHKATYLAPVGIGLALFIAELMSVYYTGGSLNPARSFGPCVVLRSFNGYHWIYWVGPALGAIIAAGFYKFIKYLEYETVLGPEDTDAAPQPAPGGTVAARPPMGARLPTMPLNMHAASSGGAPALTGPNVAPGMMYEREAKAEGPTMAIQGAGLGDLLTQGSPATAFDSDQYYADRFDRIETILSQIIAHHSVVHPSTDAHTGAPPRSSMATLTENDYASNNGNYKKGNAGFERNGELEAGQRAGQGHIYGVTDANGHVTGETTLPGHRNGTALGNPVTEARY